MFNAVLCEWVEYNLDTLEEENGVFAVMLAHQGANWRRWSLCATTSHLGEYVREQDESLVLPTDVAGMLREEFLPSSERRCWSAHIKMKIGQAIKQEMLESERGRRLVSLCKLNWFLAPGAAQKVLPKACILQADKAGDVYCNYMGFPYLS